MPAATASPIAESDGSTRHGQDLFDFVDAHPDGLPPSPIQRILSQIADAVYFLHEHSIVHRDIKDENCVLDPDGNVRLIDFGSAAYVKEGRKFDTFSGTLECVSSLCFCTFTKLTVSLPRSFAAPEVLKGARYSGKEQDIWALGVLGYVLICGTLISSSCSLEASLTCLRRGMPLLVAGRGHARHPARHACLLCAASQDCFVDDEHTLAPSRTLGRLGRPAADDG